MVPAVAVKVAVVLPAATVTVAGTVNPATLLDSATVAPPDCVTVTVQVEVPPGPRLVGLHANPLRVAAVTVPPTPVSVSESPEASTPNAPVTLIAVLATPDARVTATTATTPFCITLVFMPVSRQVYAPEFEAQLIVLLAAFALVLAIALIDAMAAGE